MAHYVFQVMCVFFQVFSCNIQYLSSKAFELSLLGWARLHPESFRNPSLSLRFGGFCAIENSRANSRKYIPNCIRFTKTTCFFSSSWNFHLDKKKQICHLWPLLVPNWLLFIGQSRRSMVIHGHSDCCQTLSMMYPRNFQALFLCVFFWDPSLLHNIQSTVIHR